MVKRHHLAFQPKAADPPKSSSTIEPPQNSKQPTKTPSAPESNNNTPPPSIERDQSKNTKTNPPVSSTKSIDNSSTTTPPPPHTSVSDKPASSAPTSKPTATSENKSSPSDKKEDAGGSSSPASQPTATSESKNIPAGKTAAAAVDSSLGTTSKPSTPSESQSSPASKTAAVGSSQTPASKPSSTPESKSSPLDKSEAGGSSGPTSKPTVASESKSSPTSKTAAEGGSSGPTSKPTAIPENKSSPAGKAAATEGSLQQSTHPSSLSNSAFTKSSNNDNGQNGDKILGIEIATIIQASIIIGVVAIIIIILVILYRRYRTRVDYNESPQNFAHKPQLTFAQEYQLNHTKIKPLFNQNRLVIQRLNPVEGLIYKTQFKSNEKSAIYFKRLLKTVSYFEVQVLNANGPIQIGFLPKSAFEKFKTGNQALSSTGVSITNTGFVQAEGENVYNYSWNLAYGDVFGIGLTRQTSKFSQRRAWISKNGILLNSPPSDELDKWLATIQISAEQKNQYNLGIDKKGKGQDEEENEQDIKDRAKKEKLDALLKKQRISLKTFNEFEYFAVVICHGNDDDAKCTVVNINVGGQVFRMFDSNFRAGLLKDKGFFGDD